MGANMPDWDKWFLQQDKYIDDYAKDAEVQRNWIEKQQSLANSTLHDYIKQMAPQAAASFDFAKQLQSIYRSETVPAMQKYMKDALAYDTPERRERMATQAYGDVRKANEARDNAEMAQLRQAGIDPNDPRYARARAYDDPQQAAQEAAAANKARYDVEDRGLEMRGQAINLGQGIGQLGMQAAQMGQQQAAGGMAAVQSGTQVGAALQGLNQGVSNQQQQLTQNLLNSRMARYQAGVQARAQSGGGMAAGLGGAIGSLAGAGLGAWLGAGAGPLGMLAGAQMGQQMGGQVVGGAMGGMPAVY